MNEIITQNHLIDRSFNTIFHISDIHIRNDQDRKEEFTTQFNRTFSIIENHPKYQKKTSLIMVTGDILDNGLRNSAISIDLLRILIDGLTKLASTIIIPGNHDYKKDVGHCKIDILSAIFNHSIQNRPDLFYLKDSGIYHFGDNLVFGHTSVNDNRFIRSDEIIATHKHKIGLFHGMVDETNSTKKHLDYQYTYQDFIGYDKVLLGDIHRCYPVAKNMWYAGSLIQKSWSEDRHLHGGLLVWDLLSKNDPQFIHIQNDHAFISLKIVKGEIRGEFKSPSNGSLSGLTQLNTFDVNDLPKKTSVKFKCDQETTSTQIDLLCEQLEKYTDIKSRRQECDMVTTHTHLQNNSIEKLPTMDTYLDHKYTAYKTKLLLIDNEYRNKQTIDDSLDQDIGKWCPILLQMTNMFSYQNKHTIDFQKIPQNNIISIHGKNGSGKSKILETILIAIYGCSPNELSHIINLDSKTAKTKIEIKLNNDIYKIERSFAKGKKSIPSPIIYINDIIYSASNKKGNEDYIKQLLGAKDDLLTTHFSKQGCHEDFIKKKPKEQLELLAKVFNTDIYTYIQKQVKDDIKELKITFKQLDKQLKEIQTDFIQPNIIENNLFQIDNKTNILQLQITQLTIKLKHSSINYQHKILLEKEIKQRQEEIKNITIPDADTDTLLDTIQTHITEKYKQIYPILPNLKQEIHNLQVKKKILTKQIITKNKLQTKIEQERILLYQLQETKNIPLKKWTYTNIEDYPQSPIKDKDNLEKLTNIIIQIGVLPNKNIIETQYKIYIDHLDKKKQLEKNIYDTKSDLTNYQKNKEDDIYRYNHYCYQCQYNKEINRIPYLIKKIDESSCFIQEKQKILETVNNYLQEHKDILKIYEKNTIIEKTNSEINTHHLYNEYLEYRDYLNQIKKTNNHILELQNNINLNNLDSEITKLELDNNTIECRLSDLSIQSNHIKTNQILERDLSELHIKQKQLINDKNILSNINNQKTHLLNKKKELEQIPKIDMDYPELETKLKDINKLINGLELEKGRNQSLLEQMTNHQTRIQQLTIERDENEYNLKLLEFYKQITIDFPLYINEKGIETLKNKINFYLRNMTNLFTVDIIYNDINKKPNIQFIKYDNLTKFKIPILDYCSGFETFIISICLRISLANITTFRSIDMLMIDEGFGVFDTQNIKLLPNMLDSLKKMFRYIFIITHIEDLQNEISQKISIIKNEKGSMIEILL